MAKDDSQNGQGKTPDGVFVPLGVASRALSGVVFPKPSTPQPRDSQTHGQHGGLLQTPSDSLLTFRRPTGLAFGNPPMHKQPPDAQQPRGHTDQRTGVTGMPANGHRNGQPVANQRANASALLAILQFQHLQGRPHVVGQNRQCVERLIGDQFLAGRMVQIQVAEPFAASTLCRTLERMTLKHGLRTPPVTRFARHNCIAPKHLPLRLVPQRGKCYGSIHVPRRVSQPRELFAPLVGRTPAPPSSCCNGHSSG